MVTYIAYLLCEQGQKCRGGVAELAFGVSNHHKNVKIQQVRHGNCVVCML